VAILTIRKLGDPILKSKSAPVTAFDAELRALSEDMHETMAAAPGVGLAAPQVGKPIRMFVYNSGEDGESGCLVNPTITWFGDEKEEAEEGCLSIPGQYFPVERSVKIRIRAQDLDGVETEREAEGFLARIFQHETDHLDGILFVDRLAPDVRKAAMKAIREQDFGMSPPPAKAAAEHQAL
jgi:peptide deformylase